MADDPWRGRSDPKRAQTPLGMAPTIQSAVRCSSMVRPDNSTLDLSELAALAVAPDMVGKARARLAAAGIDANTSVVVETQATAYGGEILSGIATVKVNGSPHDIVILDNGLILIPGLKKTGDGKARLLAAARSAPPIELAKANTFIGLEDVDRVVISRRSPVRAEVVCKDGRTFDIAEAWGSDRLNNEAHDAFFAVLGRFVAQPAGRR